MARPISHDPSHSSYPTIQDPVPSSGARYIEPICCACSLLSLLATKIGDVIVAIFQSIGNLFFQSASTTPSQAIDPRVEGRQFLCALFRKYHYTPEALQTRDRRQLLTELGRCVVYELVMDNPLTPLPFFAKGYMFTRGSVNFESTFAELRQSFNALGDLEQAHATTQFTSEAEISSPSNRGMVHLLRHTNILAGRLPLYEPFENCVNEAIAAFTSSQTNG